MHSAKQRKKLSPLQGGSPSCGKVMAYLGLFLMTAVISLLPTVASASAGDLSLFGPKRYERIQGKPWVFTDSFNGCSSSANQALIRVQNGANNDSSLSSALINLNGANIFVENDFKNQTALLEKYVTILPGTNSFSTELKSGGQKETPFLEITVIGLGCDSTPPLISALQPVDGALLNSSLPVISAAYSDNSGGAGIDTASVRITLDGNDITAGCTVGETSVSCTPSGNLPEGIHNVTLALADLLQNTATANWHFTTDTIAPIAAITAPANGQYLASRTVTVSGSIDDQTAQVTVNSTQLSAGTSTKTATISGALFSVADIALTEGVNTLTLIATDPAGNRTESSITVTVDTSLPQIVITSPINGSFTGSNPINVSGTVDEQVTAVTVNGEPGTVNGLTFTSDLTLAEGLNTLTATATDRAGNKGTTIVTVNLDTVKPLITITSPANGILTKSSSLTVSGRVSEPVLSLTVNGEQVTVNGEQGTVNGQPVAVNGLTFTAAVTLLEGQNSITLTAIDRAGNSGSATITVTLDSTPPTAPALEALTTPTNSSPVTVSGSAEPWSSLSLYNGTERVATIVTPDDGRFSFPEIILHEGENSFTVTALDLAGNESSPFAPVAVVFDTVKPLVGITAPLDKAILNTSSITVSGPIDDQTATVTVNGLPTLNSGGTWSLENFTLQEGSNALLVEATDPAGNKGSATISVTLDTVQPAGTITINSGAPVTGAALATLTLSATDESGVESMQLSNDGTTWSDAENFASTKTWDLTAGDGTKQVYGKYQDKAGNWSETVTATIILDTIPPVVAATPAGGLYRSQQDVVLSASEAVAIYFTTDGTTPSALSALYSQPVSIPASATLSFFAKDPAGNLSPVKIESYTIDTVPPVVTISSHTHGQYISTPAITLSGTVDDPIATVAVNSLSAPLTGLNFAQGITLTEGQNTITAIATDPAGNSGSASINITLDTIAPSLTVSTLSDNSYTNNETLNISGTVTDVGGLDKLLINSVPVTVNADGSYSHAVILQAGPNTITVEAFDKATNKSSNSRIINLDQTAPQLTIITPADNSKTGVKLIDISGTVDEQSTVEIKVKDVIQQATMNGTSTPLSTGLTFTASVIPEYGYNTIEIIARDRAGNPGSQKRTVIFDDKKPSVAITEPAQDLRTNISSLLLKGTASDADGLTAVSVTLTKDGEIFTPPVINGAYEQAITFSEEKSYAIIITAKDEAGNETVVQRNIIYDITPPAITVNLFDSPVNQASQIISGSREAGVEVTVTSATAVIGAITYGSDTTWQATVTGLGVNNNDIIVTAADIAGNLGNTATQIIYDNTPPVITITAPLTDAFLKTPQITVSGSVSEPVTSITVNGQQVTVNGLTFTAVITLVEGSNSIAVSAIDRATNSSTATVPVTLDTASPVITVTAPLANVYLNTPQIIVTGMVSEPVTALTVNGQPATINGLTFTSALTLTEGLNSLTIKALDRAGNEGTATLPINLDTLLPVVTIAAPANGLLTKSPQITVSGTVSEENTAVTVNGQPATVNGPTFTSTLTLAEGQNALSVKAVDRAGNAGVATVTVNLDSTSPTQPLLTPLPTPTNVAAVTISGTAEAGSSVKIAAAGALIATVIADAQGSFTQANVTLAEGINSYTATATDAAGNDSATSAPLTIILDTVKPVITVTAPQAGIIINTPDIAISGSISEPVASLTVNGSSTPLTDLAFTTTMALAAGSNSALITATDLAGNVATTTLSIQRDSTPPVVVITAPQAGLLTRASAIQVSGTVDDAEATLTVNGATVTSNNSTFSFTYTLSEGLNTINVEATDKAGNKGSASTTVTLDATAPVISINAPAEATAGANISINLNASDNRQFALVELKADGVPIWSGSNAPAISEAVSYRLSPTLSAGAVVSLQAKGIDTAGNETTATASIQITQAAMGPGYLQGKVLDDSRGLRLEGAEVNITPQLPNSMISLSSQADGGYFLETPAGSALVKVAKPGYTAVERTVAVIPEKNITVLDARLTKISDTKNVIDAAGGVARVDVGAGSKPALVVELNVPAAALSEQADIRLTPVSNQGLAGVLPLGWSPLAAVDIRLLDPAAATTLDATFAAAVVLKIPLPLSLMTQGTALTLAVYDGDRHQWESRGNAVIAADGLGASAEISTSGQYALLVADPAPNAPPAAEAGMPLAPASSSSPDFTAISASGKVVPQASPPSTGLKAAGEVLLTAKEGAYPLPQFTSGLVLNGRITEKFELKSGDKIDSPTYTHDIVLYRTPCITNIGGGAVSPLTESGVELRTTFPVSPSHDYTIVDLLLGKVGIEILKPEVADSCVMVGADGGRLLDGDGNVLVIPAGALAQTTPVSTKSVSGATGAVGDDFTLVKAVEVNLTRQTLAASATLSIPSPDGFNPSLPLVVAKQIDVKGVAKLKLVALAKQAGSFITSDITAAGIILPGITTSGIYYFLQAKGQLGYVTGTVTDAATSAYTGALVKTDKGSLVDLAGATGRYLLAAPIAPFVATALDLYKNDESSANSAVTIANQIVNLDLKIEKIPPTVVSVSPANGAVKVQPDVPVVVIFSKPMDKSSITSATLVVRDAASSAVAGALTYSVDSKTVTFYPVEAFKQETSYTVSIVVTVKDLQGYPLGQPVTSGFTVRKTTPPPMPAAGSVSATFPDADGFITITATQGTAPVDCTVLLINDTTGEIVSVKPVSNGSFTGRTRAQLGDEIKVVIMDYSGNQTLVSYITFKSDDGKYLVTAKGGKVEGEGGSQLDIPEGALYGPTVIKVTTLSEANLPSPLQAPGQYLAAFNIDSGGISFKSEIKLSIPLPAGFNPATPVFVTRPAEVMNEDGTIEKVFEIIDSTKVVNGRITTASPPFEGIMTFGSYVFSAFPTVTIGIVDGYTYQEMNDQPGYQPTTDGSFETPVKDATGNLIYKFDKPVQRAVIRTPAAWNYVSYANSKGFYAGMTTLYGNVGATDLEYKVTAIHPLTMQRQTITGYLSADGSQSRNVANLNFKLAEKGTIPPDKEPPVIRIEAKMVAGQGTDAYFSNGVAMVGTELAVTITVTDKAMGPATLTMELSSDAYANMRTTPLSLEQPTITIASGMNVYTYSPNFYPFFSGSNLQTFKPIEKGFFRLVVSARDAAGNLASKNLDITVIGLGEQPQSLDGEPKVGWHEPPEDAIEVFIDAPIKVGFSEAVTGVDENSFTLFDITANRAVSAAVLPDISNGQMRELLVPRNNLSYGHTYRVTLTSAITDLTAVSLPPVSWQFTTKTPLAAELVAAAFAARDIDYYDDAANGSTYAYVAAGTDGWRVVNVSDQNNMYVVWPPADYKFTSQFDYRNLAVDQQNALLAMTDNFNLGSSDYHYGYIRFYSLADPKSPVLVGREKLAEAMSGIPGRIVLQNGYAYVNTIGVGVQIVDIQAAIDRQKNGGASDGSTIVGYFDTNSPTYFGSPNVFAAYRSNAAALTTTNGKLLTLDLSFPNMPQLVKDFHPEDPDSSATPKAVFRFGAMAATADFAFRDPVGGSLQMFDLAVTGLSSGGVRIVNLTDPYIPAVIGTVKNLDNSVPTMVAREITINSALGLAVAVALDGVYVIDIRNPYDPRVLNKIVELASNQMNGDDIRMITLNGSLAVVEHNGNLYLANPASGVKAIDLGAGEKIFCNPNGGCAP